MTNASAFELQTIEADLCEALGGAAVILQLIAEAINNESDKPVAQIAAWASELRQSSHRIDGELIRFAGQPAKAAEQLRLELALMHLAEHGALLANQFQMIAEQLSEIDPGTIDQAQTSDKLAEMAELARTELDAALTAFAARDLMLAESTDGQDDQLDRLNRDVFEATLKLNVSRDQRELGLRHMIIARCIERVGDNAVDIAEQAAFLITTELRQFSDASKPRQPRPRTPA